MLKNYLKIAFRSLLKNRVYSFINIFGLSVGMAVALLIGLWIYDEVSYDTYHETYHEVAQIMQHQTFNGNIGTGDAIPRPLEFALRENYAKDFKYLAMSTWNMDHILSFEDKNISQEGSYAQKDFPEIFALKMLKGTRYGLKNPKSVLLSNSTAKALFGDQEPLNQIIKIGNQHSVKVTGVYEDLPYNTSLRNLKFISSWELYVSATEWVQRSKTAWDNNSFQLFVQIAPHTDMQTVSDKIKDVKVRNAKELEPFNPEVFLQPMSKWHLHSNFEQGINQGGRIQYVWLFGVIGIFVLLLACINFMNLSTARSEKRAKEVGIRKVIGSVKGQLIGQFLSESILTVTVAFVLAMLLTELSLPFFNEIADKAMTVPRTNAWFWMISLGFILITGLISGSYPAFYLSSFQPVKVIKGTFKAGKYAAIPRKVLVVTQFTVSVALIIGTIIIYNQIQFVKNRPIGYEKNRVISVQMKSDDFQGKLKLFEDQLKKNGSIEEIAEASSPLTQVWNNWGYFDWQGKDPNLQTDFAVVLASHDYGKTISWKIKEGRDFSRDFATDSLALIINETAKEFIGVDDPIGLKVKHDDREYHIIGVVEDVLMQSPYEPIKQTIYFPDNQFVNWIHIKLNSQKSITECLALMKPVFNKLIPTAPFEYKFVDEEFARKFESEERIGTLSSVFAGLAILISCLGLFGLASFMAEKRAKEIGIRKVLGATIFNIWRLMSRDFVALVLISCLIAIPLSYYVMNEWLSNYTYHTEISWWVFASAGLGALAITLITVSYQAIRAARVNPVNVLKDE